MFAIHNLDEVQLQREHYVSDSGKGVVMSIPKDSLPYKIAEVLIRAADDGADDFRLEFDELKERLPGVADSNLRQAIWTLRRSRYVEVTELIGAEYLRITQRLFELMDRPVMGWATKDDGLHLARTVRQDEGANAQVLHQKTGWPLRRFNPAMKWLVDRIPRQYVKSPAHPSYPYFYILGEPPVLFRLDEIIKSGR